MGGGIEIDDEYRLILVGVSFLFFFSFSILDTEIRGLAMEEAWKEGLYVFVGGKWRWLFSYRGEESILVFGRVFKHF